MTDLVKAKLRRIGSSVGILIPKEKLESLHVDVGDEIEIAVLKQRDEKELEKMFGIAKGAGSFIRDKTAREFSC